jgi:hypothetical protein
MFEDSLLESSRKLASRHPFATAVSFMGQIIVLSALLLLSLLYTETLPTQHWINLVQAPLPSPPAALTRRAVTAPMRSGVSSNALTVPPEILIHVSTVPYQGSQRNVTGIVGDVPGGIPDGVIGSMLEMMKPAAPLPVKPGVQKLRLSSGVAKACWWIR